MKFEIAIMVIILLNMFIMAIEHYNQSDLISTISTIFNVCFTTVFTMEAIIKLIGTGRYYFKNWWNDFDLIVVIISIAGT